MERMRHRLAWVLAGILAFTPAAGSAETTAIRIAQQFGLGYLPLMIMEDQKLVEKAAEAAGLPPVVVTWAKLGGTSSVNDALLSGSVDFSAGGIPGLLTLWSRTKGSRNVVKGVAALSQMPFEFIVKKDGINSLDDLTPQDKIAVTSIKVSVQALVLEMAAAQRYGAAHFDKLDVSTVSLPHADSVLALKGGSMGVVAHVSAPPFQQEERKIPGARVLFTSYDVLGGPATFITLWSTARFRDGNPKTFAAFFNAIEQATAYINADKRRAAETYKRMTGDKTDTDEIVAILDDPQVAYTMAPHGLMKIAKFMHDIGRIKSLPADWSEAYFPEVGSLKGN
ncbi:ABC transporter substrate-binding protein [Methylobacterium sp. J-030]|uniref:ABC transporter substrate-binding protein n=1 Tax=Methylobacterium sp. J-030 TaxID=2836627 RepID=UPI001FB94D9B|nr:ABC transporter substrate-binding protein [Methylobacterium sp. J-030]MCJ2072437.1 ABC transporter substrate-binding protein [Methylobacterium sp. J-030]